MRKVLLFRSPSPPSEEDKYHKELLACDLEPFSIPVLSFSFDNQQELTDRLQQPKSFGGLILTSQRAVEAIQCCIVNSISPDKWTSSIVEEWQKLNIFVVGKATGKAAKEMLQLQSSGEEAGNAEALVPIILESVKSDIKPLLFPCGNLRRETIPREMAKAGIPLHGLQVYSTCADSSLHQSLQKFMKEEGVPLYAVFFSPSGVNFTADILSNIAEKWSSVKLVAIGMTTAEAMKNKGWDVTAVAAQPNPQALAQCILDSGAKF